MWAGVNRHLASGLRAAIVCALGFTLPACSDDEATASGPGSTGAPEAGGDGKAPGDAGNDVAPPDPRDAASDARDPTADGARETGAGGAPDAPDTIDAADAGNVDPADAAPDGANETGTDSGDAGGPDASDAAPDALPRCASLDCNDGIGCTVDGCDELLGCIHTPSNDLCDDNRVCSGIETCNPATGCEPGTPLACDDSERCTFDYCSEPAGGCAHHDVSASVELLVNADFDHGANLAWRQLPVFSDAGLIWKDPALANTPDWFAWLGGMPSIGMRLWQAVEVPADAAELTLSGVYGLIPGEGSPSLSSYFRLEIRDALTGVEYGRALSLTSNQTTPPSWFPFSLTTSEPLAGKVLEVRMLSENAAGDSTNFFVDTLSLRAKKCPLQ
jgi:hypothetical protein